MLPASPSCTPGPGGLLSSCSDSIPLYSFCREARLPGLLLHLLRHSQENSSIQQVSAASQDWLAFLLFSFFSWTAISISPSAFSFSSSYLLSGSQFTNSHAFQGQADNVTRGSRPCVTVWIAGMWRTEVPCPDPSSSLLLGEKMGLWCHILQFSGEKLEIQIFQCNSSIFID